MMKAALVSMLVIAGLIAGVRHYRTEDASWNAQLEFDRQ